MAYKIIFINKSSSSFKIYAVKKHKICSILFSGQYFKFKIGNKIKDIFIYFNSKKLIYYFANSNFYNDSIKNFEKFIYYGRYYKLL